MESTQRPSGLVTFAGILGLVIGAFNSIAGLAAILDDDELNRSATEVLFGVDVSVWGWIVLAVGAIQFVIGLLIVQRQPVGLLLGVGWAALSATLSVFAIFTYPFFGVTVIGVDLLIIWALLANADEFSG